MIRRALWFSAGAATGVWATHKVHRKLRSLAPDSLAAQAANRAVGAGQRLKDFALDIRAGMAQRESELKDALGLAEPPGDAPGRPVLPRPATGRAAAPARHLRALPYHPDRRTGPAGPAGPTGKEDH